MQLIIGGGEIMGYNNGSNGGGSFLGLVGAIFVALCLFAVIG